MNTKISKGVILIISLVLLGLLSGVCVVLVKASIVQENTFHLSADRSKLSNSAKNANNVIKNSIDNIINNLDSSKSNINFVDSSTGNLSIVKSDPRTTQIANQMISDAINNSSSLEFTLKFK